MRGGDGGRRGEVEVSVFFLWTIKRRQTQNAASAPAVAAALATTPNISLFHSPTTDFQLLLRASTCFTISRHPSIFTLHLHLVLAQTKERLHKTKTAPAGGAQTNLGFQNRRLLHLEPNQASDSQAPQFSLDNGLGLPRLAKLSWRARDKTAREEVIQ